MIEEKDVFNVTKRKCFKIVPCPYCGSKMNIYRKDDSSPFPETAKCIECEKTWKIKWNILLMGYFIGYKAGLIAGFFMPKMESY